MKTGRNKIFGLRKTNGSESGFALLEYCAGASVILVVIWAALNSMSQNVSGLLGSIGSWAANRSSEIQSQK